MSKIIRDHLIKAGVANLQNYGYPRCSKDNILTDRLYSAFFKSMLEENKGISPAADKEINALLAEITTTPESNNGR